MQKRAGLLTVFAFFFILSLMVVLLFRQNIIPFSAVVFETITRPLQNTFISAFGGLLHDNPSGMSVTNRELAKKLVDQRELEKESKALRDQYDQEVTPAKSLLPARVIGFRSFIPTISLSEEIILNKGAKQGVQVGQTVVLQNNIVGSIAKVTDNRSSVSLISNTKQSLTAKANKTDALGVIRGKGNGMIVLENVVLADKLEKADLIVTNGDVDISGKGYPPDLVIGRIKSVDKKASDLFQSAEIESLIDFTRLHTVFILTEN